MTVQITPDDVLRVEWQTPEEAEDCLRDLRMYKALLLLRRKSIERLMAQVDGATLRVAADTKKPRPHRPWGGRGADGAGGSGQPRRGDEADPKLVGGS